LTNIFQDGYCTTNQHVISVVQIQIFAAKPKKKVPIFADATHRALLQSLIASNHFLQSLWPQHLQDLKDTFG